VKLQTDVNFPTPGLPDGRSIELPGRGTTFIREAAGPEGAPTLLLLHGWTANSALNFYATYAPLAQHFNIVGIDHRGHGYGIRTRSRFQLEDCADDAAMILDVLGLRSVIPVGYSMGGPIAQLLWQRHPSRVSGLVFCATAARFRDPRKDRFISGVVTGLSFASRVVPPSVNRRVSERVLVSKYDTTPLGHWAREQARLNDLRTMIEAGHIVASFDSLDWIHRVDVPTASVITVRDETVRPERQHQLADAIGGTTKFPVDGRHDVCATRPERFNDALLLAATDVKDRMRREAHGAA